jgi:hypothetical protein
VVFKIVLIYRVLDLGIDIKIGVKYPNISRYGGTPLFKN